MARIKALRHATKAWARKHHSPPHHYHNCSFIVLLLDLFEEWRLLSAGELRLRQLCRDRLTLIISQRAAYWKQRGKFRALREGDDNTRFFHARASARARRNQIKLLQVDDAVLVAHDDKVAALTDYYTTILGSTVTTSWGFSLERWSPYTRVPLGSMPTLCWRLSQPKKLCVLSGA